MRSQHAVLISGSGPAHQLQRSHVGSDEAQSGNPHRHLAVSHEKLIACVGRAFDVEADEEDESEVNADDGEVDAVEQNQPGLFEKQQRCQVIRSGLYAYSISAIVIVVKVGSLNCT